MPDQEPLLAGLVVVDHNETLVVRCGRCGRSIRVALKRLIGLKTFDCHRCWRPPWTNDQSAIAIKNNEVSAVLAQIGEGLSDAELSILIRKVAGFSDRELSDAYGMSAPEQDDLVKRLEDRIRSLCGRGVHEEP